MSDLLLGMAKPDTSGKSALYYIINADIAKTAQIVSKADFAETAENPEISNIAKTIQIVYNAEFAEIANIVGIVENFEMAETAERNKTAGLAEGAQISDFVKIDQIAEIAQNVQISKVADLPFFLSFLLLRKESTLLKLPRLSRVPNVPRLLLIS